MNCPQCGAENREGARFCDSCGAALADAGPSGEQRKTVTVLFCDVAGYTSTGDRLDPEALRRLQARYFDAAREALERHGASVEKFIGDAVMAVFGIPQVHEDDALRAARAALDLRAAVSELGLQVRIGINTGEVVAGSGGDALVTGDAVNVAARLEQAAEPGVILIGDVTHRLLTGAVTSELVGPLQAKGKTEPLRTWTLREVRPDAELAQRRLDSPFVGRARERALLRQAFDRAVDERACHLFTVLGPAGVGKSRLVGELVSEAGQAARVLSGRCLPYGEGITFWPLHELLTELDDTRSTPVQELLASGAATPEELFLAVRRLLESLARELPLVVLFDDVHWADPTFLDLLDHVSELARDAPILVVCLARPELLDHRPAWGGGKLNATSLLLEPLSPPDSEQLMTALLGDSELEGAVRSRILAAAEGNPLFVEQMLEMLIDDGLLERRDGSWVSVSDLTEVAVPPTIQALLAARLDRLSSDERTIAQRAAVEGKVFHAGAVKTLSPEQLRPAVTAHLLSLVRKELVRPSEPELAEEDAYRFRHLLIRDAAYQSLPKEQRAELHEQFADWLERKLEANLGDYEEILGYHLEQAYRCRDELGMPDEALARRAAARLSSAALRAERRGDAHAAANLLERAAALLPDGDGERVLLLPRLGNALKEIGDLAGADTALEQALVEAQEAGDRRTEGYALLQRGYVKTSVDPEWGQEHALEEAHAAIEIFEDLGDDTGLAHAWSYAGLYEYWNGRCTRAQTALEKAAVHAERAGEPLAPVWWDAAIPLHGPLPVAEADAQIAALAERSGTRLDFQGVAFAIRARLAAMAGRVDLAREFNARSKEIFTELGLRLNIAGFAQSYGATEALCGDNAAAETELRQGCELLRQLGEVGLLSTTLCYLGEVVYAEGRYEEALELTQESEQIGAGDDVMTQCAWRALRAKVLARRGEHEGADRLAREAVELVGQTDYVDATAEVYASVGEVAAHARRTDDATAWFERALDLYVQKGNTVLAERTRELLRALETQ